MTDLKKLALDILSQGYLVSLGTMDQGGVWVSDIVYTYDDNLNIYWVSNPSVRHSQALTVKPAVAATITLEAGPGKPNIGLQISGVAESVEETREIREGYAAKRQRTYEEAVRPGVGWYRLAPKVIEVIYEPLFGWEKQKIEL